MSAKTVFISYRRDAAGRGFARALETALTYRGYDVFLDVDSIDAGKWAPQISAEVHNRTHFLLLLTPGALDRGADPNDWFRREFELAQHGARNIIVIREESVDLASARTGCPESLLAVFDYQVVDVRHGSFKHDVDALVERFIAPHKAPAPQPPVEHVPHLDASRIAIIEDVTRRVVESRQDTPVAPPQRGAAIDTRPRRVLVGATAATATVIAIGVAGWIWKSPSHVDSTLSRTTAVEGPNIAEGTDAFARGRLYDALDRIEQATSAYERAVRYLPDADPNRELAKTRLDELRDERSELANRLRIR